MEALASVLILGLIVILFAPTIIAIRRGVKNTTAIVVLNIVGGLVSVIIAVVTYGFGLIIVAGVLIGGVMWALSAQTTKDWQRQQDAFARMNSVPPPLRPVTAPPPLPPKLDVAGDLERLACLRDKGILTDAEFQAQKQKILAR